MTTNEIEYFEDTKRLFYKFIEPVTINDLENKNKWIVYENEIKRFIEEQLNIKINIYFSKHYRGKLWFYLIEGFNWFVSSDDIEDSDMMSYNIALNRAIRYIFNKIYYID